MAVANQHVTTLRLPAAVAGTDARVAPRWLPPVFLVTFDGLAVLAAALVAGVTLFLPLIYGLVALGTLAAAGAYRTQMTSRALDAGAGQGERLEPAVHRSRRRAPDRVGSRRRWGGCGVRRARASPLNFEHLTTDTPIMDIRHANRRRVRLGGAHRSEA